MDLYVESKDVLDAPLSKKITKEMKEEKYKKVVNAVNALDSYRRTPQAVKEKLKSLKSRLKQKVVAEKRESKKTGGGPPELQLTEHERQLAEHFAGDPSFHGIGGAESGTSGTLVFDDLGGKFINSFNLFNSLNFDCVYFFLFSRRR